MKRSVESVFASASSFARAEPDKMQGRGRMGNIGFNVGLLLGIRTAERIPAGTHRCTVMRGGRL